MPTVEKKKCAHPACHCIVADNKKHCSQKCEDTMKDATKPCGCGHSVCSTSAK